MAFSSSHKVVFILDKSGHFAQPCEEIEIESAKSAGQSGFLPVSKITKSIWSSATESIFEYCRIVWDIFPPACDDVNEQKLIRLVTFNEKETQTVIKSWERKHQTSLVLANELALAGRPQFTSNKFSSVARAKEKLRNGIKSALELLTENSEAQEAIQEKDASNVIINRGRIVCLTFTDDLKSFAEEFVSIVRKELSEVNSNSAGSKASSSIAQLDVNVVCCFSNMNSTPKHHHLAEEIIHDVSHTVKCVFSLCPGGVELSKKMLEMALNNYDLASTTVTGIPMKEEQNASSSANYDVELFHKASTHWRLLAESDDSHWKNEDLSNWIPQTLKEGFRYNTITLKWCAPKGSSVDLHNSRLACTALSRVTPTDVNSRPSSCLTNFLLAGRSVMLEMPRRSGAKTLSHMLTSHGGEIFIHTLSISRSVLEDPPSISEGPGGRVTDYRIQDFGNMMKANRLAPYFGQVKDGESQPLEKSRERVNRHTKLSPMIISATTIFNMQALEPLQQIMVQEELTEENLAECRKIIYSLLSMEHRGEILPVPVTTSATGGKGKAMKKDDQYKIMYAELEKYINSHCRTEKHSLVLNCLLESRNRPVGDRPPSASSKRDEKTEWDMANKELDKYNSMTERERSDFNQPKRSRSPSPALTTAVSSSKRSKNSNNGNESLLDLWMKTQKENATTRFSTPFVGMRSVGEQAKLYLSLDRKDKEFMGGSGANFGE